MPLKRTRALLQPLCQPLWLKVWRYLRSGRSADWEPNLSTDAPDLGSNCSAPGTPFPTRCRAVLKYTSYCNLAAGISSAGQYFLRCNSIYDPDASGVGGQPRGFDQYALLYNQYTVNKAKLTAVVCIPATGSSGQILFGATIKPDLSGTAVVDQLADQPYTVSKISNQQDSTAGRTIRMYWDRKKRFPKNDTSLSLSAATNANPAEQEFWQVWMQSAYSPLTDAPTALTIQYQIEYDVEFYELKALAPS